MSTALGYIESPRVIVLDEPEYTASYHTADLGDGHVMTFVHLDVYYMGPSIWKRLQYQWKLWREHCPCVLYCMADVDDDKWARFVGYFGFSYLTDVGCTDGQTRRLFVNYT